MITYKTWGAEELDDKQLRQIVGRLQEGQIMIWPTDTLYAIGCSALDPKAIERICRLKGINPEKTNLSIVCSSISQASGYARWDNWVFSLLKDLTPGPYTFLLRAASTLPKVFKGRKIVGIRIPDCPIDRQIVETLGNPILSSSIAFDDQDYAINPELMAEAYEGKVDFLIDHGEGLTAPSTIIDCTGSEPEIIRQGKGEFNS